MSKGVFACEAAQDVDPANDVRKSAVIQEFKVSRPRFRAGHLVKAACTSP